MRVAVLMLAVTIVSVPAPAQVAPRLVELGPCTFEAMGERIEADCGTIAVPETHFGPSASEIRLPFVRFRALDTTGGVPLIYLAGGPGGSGIGTAKSQRFHLFMRLREAGDVVVFDQRGTGAASPSLDWDGQWNFPLGEPADFDRWRPNLETTLRACRAYIDSRGVDLSHYTTRESAADVNALADALGYGKVGLWGTSYGTHLALAVTRTYGERVARTILTGVEGPDHTLKLPSVIDDHLRIVSELSGQDEGVREFVSDLIALVRDLLARLRAQPVTASFRGEEIVLGPLDLQIYISEAVGRLRSIQPLPGDLYSFSKGDYRRLAAVAYQLRRGPVGNPMSLAMDCASGATATRLQQIRDEGALLLLGNAANFPIHLGCSGLGMNDSGDAFRSTLNSDVPLLCISGTLDARTPLRNAEEVRAGFTTSYHLIVENAGHDEELFSLAPGLGDEMVRFLRGEAPIIDRIELPPVRFRAIRE